MIEIRQCSDQSQWDELVKTRDGHPLQLWGWGETKLRHGWRADRIIITHDDKAVGGAQLLIKSLPRPFAALVYIPRGPFGHDLTDADREALVAYCKQTHHPLVITAEPDEKEPLQWKRWRVSPNTILLPRTAVMDLTETNEQLQATMSKKTRQYIRKASKEGIEVRQAQSSEDIDACLAIYKDTAHRAGFALHDDQYYHDIFIELKDASPVFLAVHNGEVVAFLWPLVTPHIAFELYGGMNATGQALRANYHLKWSVIQYMKQRGVGRYDVNGLLNDGVSAFKKGFIPQETRMAGAFDRPLSPLYSVWRHGLPVIKKVVQKLRSRS